VTLPPSANLHIIGGEVAEAAPARQDQCGLGHDVGVGHAAGYPPVVITVLQLLGVTAEAWPESTGDVFA
jgi:hypothetical protein